MNIPTRLRVLMGLTDLLKSITPANGFQSDLSDYVDNGLTKSRVFRGRNIFGDDDPLPMISILENPHTEPTMHEAPRGSSYVVGPWELLIQGFVQDDPQNPTDPAHMLMADVKQQLIFERLLASGNQNPNLLGCGRTVNDLSIGTGVVRPPDDVSAKACFWLILTLQLGEDIRNPFA